MKMFFKDYIKPVRYASQSGLNFLRNWGRPLAMYGVGAAILAVYFIDWRVIVTRIPFYRKKFENQKIE